MSALKKPVSALIGVMALLLAGVFFAASATAAPTPGPYPPVSSARITVSTTTPDAGQTVTVNGTGFQANEAAALDFHSVVTSLGTAQADASGAFGISVTIPAGASGSHEIVATGLTSGSVASVAIEVGSSGSGSGGGSGSGSGGLSNTGVAVIGIGALGVVLLIGGGLLLMAGKRRKVSI